MPAPSPQPIIPRATRRRRRRWLAWLGAAVCALVVAGVALGAVRPHSTTPAASQNDVRQALAGTRFAGAGAAAQAQVVESGSAARLVLRTQGLSTPATGHYSVWLFNSVGDARRLGALRLTAPSRFTLPRDASRYRSIHVVLEARGATVLALSGRNPADTGTADSVRHTGETAARLSLADSSWDDEFSGTKLGAHWRILTGGGGHGNDDLEDYTPSDVTVADGALHLTAKRADGSYTSGAVDTLGRVSLRYGLIEASIRVPPGPGLWPTFWLEGSDLPSVGWPQSGEIDAMEILDNDDSVNNGSIHVASQGSMTPLAQVNHDPCSCNLTAGFHVYGIDWSPNTIQFMVDGDVYATETRAAVQAAGGRWPFNKPFFVLLSLAVGGNGDGAPTAGTALPATMTVDWIRAYANN